MRLVPLRGTVLPVKLTLVNGAGANIGAASTTLHAATVDTTSPVAAPGSSQPGNNFTYNGAVYQFNLDTSGLTAGPHTLWFTITGDPTRHAVTFSVKS